MLEHPALLLLAWGAPESAVPSLPTDPRNRRPILDPETHQLLGCARRLRARWPAWFWQSTPTLEVRETDDEPLVCFFNRFWNWGPCWQVCDADGRVVATIGHRWIRNAAGEELSVVRPDGYRTSRLVSPGGVELGSLIERDDGTLLRFTGEEGGNPFTRMALLGAALIS